MEDFRVQKGFLKQLVEEIAPLVIFGKRKFGDTDQVLLQPVIGNQNYDAVVTDLRTKPVSQSYLEITQAHEGENDYWRRCELLKKGYVFSNAPVIKKGKGKNRTVSIPHEATSVEEGVKNELDRILDATKGKERKVYPTNTALLIFFDDTSPREAMNDNILNLDLRFSELYLVGEVGEIFRGYPINRKED